MRLLRVVAVLTVPAAGQWLDQPTKGIPRLADGRPNLTAQAPRGPDGKPSLSGLWVKRPSTGYVGNIAADLAPREVQPWADAVFRERLDNFGKDDPGTIGCLPLGPRHIAGAGLAKFIHTPDVLVVLHEDLTYRQIFLDGRALPIDPDPAFEGYSVGHWEDDRLVVESIGFNDRTWLDFGGHPHTASLRMTERYRRIDFGRMELEVTLEDPKAYGRPWTVSIPMGYVPDTDLIEFVCAENEQDREHLSGSRGVKVPRETLAQYVGVYELRGADLADFAAARFDVILEGDELLIDIGGKGKLPMVPISETQFSPRLLGTFEFVRDANGTVTHLIAYSTEGDRRAERVR